jgi:hypothetical protein
MESQIKKNQNDNRIGKCNCLKVNIGKEKKESETNRHFPIQKFLKILPKTSSVVISPVISPK